MSVSIAKTYPAAPPVLSQSALSAHQMGADASPEIPLSLLLGEYAPSLSAPDTHAVSALRELPAAAVNG